ncbi:MAG: Lrp/AsnC family transcriptional regulator [Candidatus Eremiobacteraeota bacterium]|nr:Lrp/AsnC family transcriptional regulator [Candidatus Eremiobacteraeota bacterium]
MIDEIDAIILRELLADARASYKKLAQKALLSANAVAERLRKMQRDGTIRSFSVDVSPQALGQRLFALIDMRFAAGTVATDFERELAGMRHVLSYTLTTGRSDCMLKVAVADQDNLAQVLDDFRTRFGAVETYSRIILREHSYAPKI